MPIAKARREEFTPKEYRKLHSFARSWIKEARNDLGTWYRTMAYNFMLIMTNTGMRPSEARNLRWRDVGTQNDKQGRQFVRLNVRGKGKYRTLVAAEQRRDLPRSHPSNQQTHRTLTISCSRPTRGRWRGRSTTPSSSDLLIKSELQKSSSGSRRSTYCFRHTYATFRLTEGVDVYFLAKQMGTSVKMIEDHYGHITPVKNADRILQGLPGWEPIAAAPQEAR